MEVVNVVIPPLPSPYTYLLPERLAAHIQVGCEVEVPLGSRSVVGYVVPLPDGHEVSTKFELKPISRIRRVHPLFLKSQLEFFQWVADYYAESLSSVIETAIPPPVPQKFEHYLSLVAQDLTPDRKPGKVEQQILSVLQAQPEPISLRILAARIKGARPAVKRLVERGLVTMREQEILDQHLLSVEVPSWAKTEVTLSEAQQAALNEVRSAFTSGKYSPFLLDGVTGSGKTEVYIEAAREVVATGRSVLVIVPEIALTPQLIDRFRARLGTELAVLHSGLHPRVRWDGWRALLEGRCHIGIGARSAVFAPLHNLGLIIVDEEHDSSYKQQEGLRYHARDLALVRAKMNSCPVILGTATPSLETFSNVANKKYGYLRLSSRPGTTLPPTIEVVDLNHVKPWEMKSRSVSPKLYDALASTIAAGNQTFILYNRRGFASYLQCERCEEVVKCPNCSVTFTYHKNNHSLVCHYCGTHAVPPSTCRECESLSTKSSALPANLLQRGSGTERIYDELRELFPDVSMDRLDRDAVTDGDQYRRILDRMRSGETSVLVGTQMIAKGHDLPGVTLVGVVDCDVGLHMPDFRAAERVFQLLTQASGRSGRADKAGQVILQTRVPKHPSIVSTEAHDYRSFALAELETRKMLRYPPFSRMLRIVASSAEKSLGGATLEQFARELDDLRESHGIKCSVLGPCAAPIEKIKTLWRWHLLVKSSSPKEINFVVRTLQLRRKKSKQVRVIFDIDPQEML